MDVSSKVLVPQEISPLSLDRRIFHGFRGSLVVVEPVDDVEEASLAHIEDLKGFQLTEFEEKSDQLADQRMLKRQIVGVKQQQ